MDAGDYEWIATEDWAGFRVTFGLIFVGDADPDGVLARIGGRTRLLAQQPMTQQELAAAGAMGSGRPIGAVGAGGWTLLYEVHGVEGMLSACGLSQGTEVIAVSKTLNSITFTYCADGETVVEFDARSADDRHGSRPDRLLGQMAQVGLLDDEPGDHDRMILALASRLTGVIVTPQLLSGPFQWTEVINEPPAQPPAADQIVRSRDPELAMAIRQAVPESRAQAVACYLAGLATDAGANEEPVIVEALTAVQRDNAELFSAAGPDLERLFTSWRAEAADLPRLHEIDRRRDHRTFTRFQQASARGVFRKALQQVLLARDPAAAAYTVLEGLDRYARPDRHAEVMRLLGAGRA
jgi:hypothetical protein